MSAMDIWDTRVTRGAHTAAVVVLVLCVRGFVSGSRKVHDATHEPAQVPQSSAFKPAHARSRVCCEAGFMHITDFAAERTDNAAPPCTLHAPPPARAQQWPLSSDKVAEEKND